MSASSPPSSFQSSLIGRKLPSSFKISPTGRRRRAFRHRFADYRGHRRRSRRSVRPSSLLSCDSRVLWHSNGAHTRCCYKNSHARVQHGTAPALFCVYTTRKLVPSQCRAEPARFKSRVKTGTAPDTLARHGTALVAFTRTILESRCRAGTAPSGSVNAVLVLERRERRSLVLNIPLANTGRR